MLNKLSEYVLVAFLLSVISISVVLSCVSDSISTVEGVLSYMCTLVSSRRSSQLHVYTLLQTLDTVFVTDSKCVIQMSICI